MSNVTINQLPVANTIDGVSDYLPIYTASGTATQGINRNTLLGLSSAPVGLTDSQTLTNKILTSPTINGATLSGTLLGTYTLGGTPTFPASVVTLTGTQVLTNKTLTSPTITAPTITNATITADTLSGFTTSNNGTVYGISVTGGTIGSAALASNSVNTAQITSGIQLPDRMKNPYKFRVYRAAALNTGNNAFALVPHDTKSFDTSSNVDVVTNKGRFTAPIAGFYFFTAQIAINGSGADTLIVLYKNGAAVSYGSREVLASAVTNCVVSDLLSLAANDYVEVFTYSASTKAFEIGSGAAENYFAGFLVSAT